MLTHSEWEKLTTQVLAATTARLELLQLSLHLRYLALLLTRTHGLVLLSPSTSTLTGRTSIRLIVFVVIVVFVVTGLVVVLLSRLRMKLLHKLEEIVYHMVWDLIDVQFQFVVLSRADFFTPKTPETPRQLKCNTWSWCANKTLSTLAAGCQIRKASLSLVPSDP